ncbi:MAG: hypothetical protein Q4D61_04360 [Cardiobacteriaceae bacterium]|nr:hypothetical protein [Cardiobacteriaceae bacterium]
MKKLLLPLVFCAGLAEAAECPAPDALAVAGIRMGATLAEVQQAYPAAALDGTKLAPIERDEVSRRDPGISTLRFVGMDGEGRVNAISASFEAPLATPETAPEDVLKNVIAHYQWPADGWEKRALMDTGEMKELGYSEDAARFVLDCEAYQIEVAQDFGVGQQSLGASLLVEVKK